MQHSPVRYSTDPPLLQNLAQRVSAHWIADDGRCVDSRPSDQPGSSATGHAFVQTSDAATSTSPLTHPHTTG